MKACGEVTLVFIAVLSSSIDSNVTYDLVSHYLGKGSSLLMSKFFLICKHKEREGRRGGGDGGEERERGVEDSRKGEDREKHRQTNRGVADSRIGKGREKERYKKGKSRERERGGGGTKREREGGGGGQTDGQRSGRFKKRQRQREGEVQKR